MVSEDNDIVPVSLLGWSSTVSAAHVDNEVNPPTASKVISFFIVKCRIVGGWTFG